MCERSLLPLFYFVFDLRCVSPKVGCTVQHTAIGTSLHGVSMACSPCPGDEHSDGEGRFCSGQALSSEVDGLVT